MPREADDVRNDECPPAGVGDVARTVAGVDIFEATFDRPPRPDLPLLRNWSHTKSHAVQLGVGFAVFAYFAAAWGETGAVVGASTLVINRVFGDRQKKNPRSTSEHSVGAHDVVRKPHYFVSAVLATLGVLYVFVGTVV